MAAVPQQTDSNVATLKEKQYKSISPTRDAIRRLFRNRLAVLGLIIIIMFFLMAIFAPVIAPFPYEKQDLIQNNATPLWVTKIFPTMIPKGEPNGYVTISDKFPIGADSLGRDLLSRIIYGAQVSLAVAIVGPITATLIGVTLGLVAGYFGGWADTLIMRIVDIVYAFPTILLIILLMSFFRSGVFSTPEMAGTIPGQLAALDRSSGGMLFIFIGIGMTSWVTLARLTRGQVLSVRENDYVLASRALGVPRNNIIFRHLLPNILGPLIILETLTIPNYIRYEAFLSFIGLGVNEPFPSWGKMISDAAPAISSYPNQAIFPALALFLLMFAFNFLGDGLRDAFDARMRGVD